MKKLSTGFLTLIAAMPLSAWATGNLFTGSIAWNTSSDPIIATEQWASSATTLSWNISYNAQNPFPWEYQYSWNTAAKGLSHIILEVSSNSSAADFSLPAGSEGPRVWSPSDPGKSNPGLPGDIFGIKYAGGGEISKTFTFRSTHAPTWGDFYSQDGVNRHDGTSFDVYAYNSGFFQSDPLVDFAQIAQGDSTTLQHTGPRANHISLPDTLALTPREFNPPPVPEATAGWGLVGLIGVAAYSVQRKRQAATKVA